LTTLPNGYQGPGQLLTPGLTKTVSYYDPDQLVSYTNQQMWELNPVEVRARTRPTRRFTPLPAPEQAVFAKVGVNPAQFQSYLAQHNLAVVVSRNVTTRDDADHQQPFNLRVAGTNTQTVRPKAGGNVGKIYDIAYIQFFQGDQIRGLGLQTSSDKPRDGR